MAMSRASMQQQLRGNRMKKKSVGGFLETFSPVYSIAKGKGPIGEAVRGIHVALAPRLRDPFHLLWLLLLLLPLLALLSLISLFPFAPPLLLSCVSSS